MSDELTPHRPRVVVSVTASPDGRVTLRRTTTLLDPDAQHAWRALHPPGADRLLAERHDWLESTYGHRVVLEGSGTFVAEGVEPAALPAPDADPATLRQSYLPPSDHQRWFVVIDGRGRVRWQFRGDDEVRLLILVCRATPPAYLAYLRREEIPYLVAGDDRVDLPTALTVLGTELGAATVISEAGGGLNGALLRAGLVDEVHLVLLPALIGGRDTPSVFDGSPLGELDAAVRLRLVHTRTSEDGAVWLHYEVTDRPDLQADPPAGPPAGAGSGPS